MPSTIPGAARPRCGPPSRWPAAIWASPTRRSSPGFWRPRFCRRRRRMAHPGDLDRTALLALTPARALVQGYRDAAGRPRAELRSILATAAATQLEQGQASPQEVFATFEALELVLPL